MKIINVFDFDGVTSIGLLPSPNDIIVTGRPLDEAPVVLSFLAKRGIMVPVCFYPGTLQERGKGGTMISRENSAKHKVQTIVSLTCGGFLVKRIFEDDPIQVAYLQENLDIELEKAVSARMDSVKFEGIQLSNRVTHVSSPDLDLTTDFN